ncbi:undecaprenyl-diphosphatase [Chitinophaga terrae (ex Kim and Jung 2007)]|uniref:Undecaprenyl-diphosphatase n=1 Tax=Chitinophaga terrae (ex Kim and Jung 2007) TaxID=408074 RepID=A0A1H3Y5M2_9BACT|nr:undecaprenyl-diphosphate phosphatase [Chitinophaga terrae (ex Kim and Jung 2007)]MDQ0107989.1 undecaprenyl-diphosphatase [Chitinophaga terrae (ex Kim and Jung 2007)]GEP90918.1 undecaprenyl-diphosphatase [Chitinophaga terrae (ex Kim and Jung 2007)]SEA06987.1 undecaprenyl-diphosphatase [Chitinophaga terrae (ex Kim and Jung 2007)]
MNVFQAIIIAIVEGLTEFLPISSTGHMIIVSALLGIGKDEFTKLFEVVIQLGAILAVVVLYWRKFFVFDKNRFVFYLKLVVAVIPALILGYLFSDKIDQLLESPLTVGITLLLGGIILLFVDNWFQHPKIDTEEKIDIFTALRIGFYQCLAMIPGTSRSAASIIGGMQQKLTRNVAAEFSFFLAVPTMAAATGYKLLKGKDLLLAHPENLKILLIGNIVAFVVALLAIRFFIGTVKRFGFKMWGYYRIIVGLIIIIAILTGYNLEV